MTATPPDLAALPPLATPPRPGRRTLGALVLALALAGAAWAFHVMGRAPDAGVEVARPAPFEVAIEGIGDLVPKRRHMIAASFSGKVLEIAPEGNEVKAGAVVARIGTQEIEENKQSDELDLEGARKDLEFNQAEAARDREKQRTAVAAARAERDLQALLLRQIEAGTPKPELAELVLRDEAARRSLANAEEAYQAQAGLVEKGIIRPLDLKKGKVDLAGAQRAAAVAATALRIARAGYADYAIEAQRLEALKAARKCRLAERKLAHLVRIAGMRRAVDLARVRFLESRVADHAHRMNEAILRAPAAGVVVLQSIWTNSGRKKLQVGDEARELAAFMEIADVSAIFVKTHVKEADVGRVRLGMPARITVASLGKSFDGTLSSLGVLALEKPGLINREGAPKVFEALVATDGRSTAFRPGMTVDVALVVRTVPDALSVPNGAVFHREGRPCVRARRPGGRWEVRPLSLGEHTAKRTRVTAGLAAGDELRTDGNAEEAP